MEEDPLEAIYQWLLSQEVRREYGKVITDIPLIHTHRVFWLRFVPYLLTIASWTYIEAILAGTVYTMIVGTLSPLEGLSIIT